MRLFKQFLGGMSVAALLMLAGVTKTQAQIWAYYDMEIVNQFYNPLINDGSLTYQVLTDVNFKDFAGFTDRDDGVLNNVPVGFNFEYNGGMYSTVNVCVNGWASVGQRLTPVITHDIYYLFRPNEPNNTLAPFWGDHFYRSPSDIGAGYKPSTIHKITTAVPNSNPAAPPGTLDRTFTLEWKDLNINDKSNVNSIASFQIKIIQNENHWMQLPDHRATIEFHYGSVGNLGTVKTQGSTVGIEDSVSDILAHSFMNGLFPSSFANEDSTRLNKDSLTSCWPPATCLPGRVIRFTPEGKGKISEWGDGDVNLTQLDASLPAEIRGNQNRFVTLADADSLLRAVARAYPPLDSVEGRQAFHGDANHNGRYTNDQYPGFYFYRVTAYDAAYIMLYLAAKLPFLPWPQPLPVPVYKDADMNTTNISAIYADVKNSSVRGSTTLIPLVLRGTVNGPLSFDMTVKSVNESMLTFAGAESVKGLIRHNGQNGKVVFAAAGNFTDGEVLGYLQFNAASGAVADFVISDVMINDESYPGQRSTLDVDPSKSVELSGNALEQNAPNPFNMTQSSITTIRYNLENASIVTIKVFDALGNEIRTLANANAVTGGTHTVQWDGRDNNGALVASGAYYYQLTTPDFVKTAKMQVVR